MLFNSIDFLVFFPIVAIVYFLVPQKIKHIWLLITSYYFYMCWNAKYALLILFSTLVTYFAGIVLERIKSIKRSEHQKILMKNLTLICCLLLNLLVLFYFKYFNFCFSLLSDVLLKANIELSVSTFDIILPVGISFYTFQALSYTLDVYRDEIHAESNLFYYALFVSFFPQLVAGPIERSGNLLGQLRKPARFNAKQTRDGLLLMLWGFFLKIVLADRIAIFVDTVYGDCHTYGGCYLIVATMLFAVQIYCDFAGYSVIAMGTAKILGIDLMDNFNAPYFVTSVAAFWRNWHISLKDYLYIPLGGGRKGKLRRYINKLIVFLVSGLWHGADLSFVVWGGLNGLYQIIGEISQPARERIIKAFRLNRENVSHKVVQGLFTFVLVDFAWIFFRASTVTDAIEIVRQMFRVSNAAVLFDGSLYECGLNSKNFLVMGVSIGILAFADICKCKGIVLRNKIANQDSWFQWLLFAVSIGAILTFGIWGPEYNQVNFIYFQF